MQFGDQGRFGQIAALQYFGAENHGSVSVAGVGGGDEVGLLPIVLRRIARQECSDGYVQPKGVSDPPCVLDAIDG